MSSVDQKIIYKVLHRNTLLFLQQNVLKLLPICCQPTNCTVRMPLTLPKRHQSLSFSQCFIAGVHTTTCFKNCLNHTTLNVLNGKRLWQRKTKIQQTCEASYKYYSNISENPSIKFFVRSKLLELNQSNSYLSAMHSHINPCKPS